MEPRMNTDSRDCLSQGRKDRQGPSRHGFHGFTPIQWWITRHQCQGRGGNREALEREGGTEDRR